MLNLVSKAKKKSISFIKNKLPPQTFLKVATHIINWLITLLIENIFEVYYFYFYGSSPCLYSVLADPSQTFFCIIVNFFGAPSIGSKMHYKK